MCKLEWQIDKITFAKVSQEIISAANVMPVMSRLAVIVSCSLNMQWSEIANSAVTEWFATLAKAKGTCPEFILVGVLPTVSALMGNTTVQIFDGYEERVNLYMLGLGGPSTGRHKVIGRVS